MCYIFTWVLILQHPEGVSWHPSWESLFEDSDGLSMKPKKVNKPSYELPGISMFNMHLSKTGQQKTLNLWSKSFLIVSICTSLKETHNCLCLLVIYSLEASPESRSLWHFSPKELNEFNFPFKNIVWRRGSGNGDAQFFLYSVLEVKAFAQKIGDLSSMPHKWEKGGLGEGSKD